MLNSSAELRESTEGTIVPQTVTSSSSVAKPQFDALTSLRFFAAAMIVFHHCAGHFFVNSNSADTLQLDQGVSFFFVLSGFILTYVYPNLKGLAETKRFLFARLGRIWPGHLVTACLTLWLMLCDCPKPNAIWTNILLLQSWIPDQHYFFSLNSVAWSISDELFFYICFVLLIKPWKFGWVGKIALGLGLVLFSCFLAKFIAAPGNNRMIDPQQVYNLPYYFLCINPLARLAEFILGMFTARLWLRFGQQIRFNKWAATIVEFVIVAAVIFEITHVHNAVPEILPVLKQFAPLSFWLLHSGGAPLFALLIFGIATKRGYLAQALANPVLVWLGEISYSIYLVHYPLIKYFFYYIPEFSKLNCWLAFFVYLALVILFSHINFTLVESPCRKLIKTLASSSRPHLGALNVLSLFSTHFRSAMVAVLLTIGLAVGTAAYINTSQSRFKFVDLTSAKNIRFENRFVLEKICVSNAVDGSKIKLFWKSLIKQRLRYNVAIYFLDAQGNWLSQHDYRQSLFYRMVNPDQSWSDTQYISAIDRKGLKDLGVIIYTTNHPDIHLSVEGGQRDWWNSRAIIPVSKEALQIN